MFHKHPTQYATNGTCRLRRAYFSFVSMCVCMCACVCVCDRERVWVRVCLFVRTRTSFQFEGRHASGIHVRFTRRPQEPEIVDACIFCLYMRSWMESERVLSDGGRASDRQRPSEHAIWHHRADDGRGFLRPCHCREHQRLRMPDGCTSLSWDTVQYVRHVFGWFDNCV